MSKKSKSKKKQDGPVPGPVGPAPESEDSQLKNLKDRCDLFERLRLQHQSTGKMVTSLCQLLGERALSQLRALHAAHTAYEYPGRQIVMSSWGPLHQNIISALVDEIRRVERVEVFDFIREALLEAPEAVFDLEDRLSVIRKVIANSHGGMTRNVVDLPGLVQLHSDGTTLPLENRRPSLPQADQAETTLSVAD